MLTLSLYILLSSSCSEAQQIETLNSDTIVKFYMGVNSNNECVPNGEWKEFTGNNTLRISGEFNYGIPSGNWIYYNPGGKIKKQILHNPSGVPHGIAIYWYSNGQIWQRGYYCSGLTCGKWTQYWENGIVKSVATWQSGKLNGPISNYFPNGQLAAAGYMNQDKKVGKWVWYNTSGEIVSRK